MRFRRARGNSRIEAAVVGPSHAANARSVERRRFGLPPGGFRGPPSSASSASNISSMVTGAFSPVGALNDGQEAIAEASEAQDARIALFSDRLSEALATTSLGCVNTVPG